MSKRSIAIIIHLIILSLAAEMVSAAAESSPSTPRVPWYASAAREDSPLLPNRLLWKNPYPYKDEGIPSTADHCVQLYRSGKILLRAKPEYYKCALGHNRLILIDMNGNKEFAPAGVYYKKKENKVFNVGTGGFPLDPKLRRSAEVQPGSGSSP